MTTNQPAATSKIKWTASPAIAAVLLVLAAAAPSGGFAQEAQDQKSRNEECYQGEPDARMAACTRTIEDSSASSGDREGALLARARLHEASGDWDAAIADYGRAVESDPTDAEYRFMLGSARAAKGDAPAAIKDFSGAIAKDPEESEYRATRAAACALMGDIDGAIIDLTAAIALEDDTPAHYFYRGDAYRARGETDRAIADFSEAIRLQPDGTAAYLARAELYRAQRKYERAIADYADAIRLDDTMAGAYFGRAVAYLGNKLPDRALADLDRGIALDPNNAAMRNMRGFVHAARGDHDKAIADHSAAIVLAPIDAYRYAVRAWAYLQAGKPDLGFPDAEKAILLDPENATGYAARSYIKKALGKVDESEQDLAEAAHAAALSSDPAGTFKRLGRVPPGFDPPPENPGEKPAPFDPLARLMSIIDAKDGAGTVTARHNDVVVRSGPALTFAKLRTLDKSETAQAEQTLKYKETEGCGLDGASAALTWYKLADGGYVSARDMADEEEAQWMDAADKLERTVSDYEGSNYGALEDFAGIYDGLKDCKTDVADGAATDGLALMVEFTGMLVKQVIWFEGDVMASVRFNNPGVVSRGKLKFLRNFSLQEGGAIKLYRITYDKGNSETIGFYRDTLVIDPKINKNRINYNYAKRCDNETGVVEWAKKLYNIRAGVTED